MIYNIVGKVTERGEDFFILEILGIGLKIFSNTRTLNNLPASANKVKVFTFLYIREDSFELYGFLKEEELRLFEMLNSVAGIGPKTALSILDIDSIENIMAAIIEKRSELLTRGSGIGRKTAERIILELHNKIKLPKASSLTKVMDLNNEIEEILISLGYRRAEIRQALTNLNNEKSQKLEERLREVLKILSHHA
mgnify:CR=1 FL=1